MLGAVMLAVTKSNFLLSRCPRFAMVQLRMGKGRASRHTARHGLTFVAVELSRVASGRDVDSYDVMLNQLLHAWSGEKLEAGDFAPYLYSLAVSSSFLVAEHIFCRWSVYKGLDVHDLIPI